MLKTKKKTKVKKSHCNLCVLGKHSNKESMQAIRDIKYKHNLIAIKSINDLIKKTTRSKSNKKSLLKS